MTIGACIPEPPIAGGLTYVANLIVGLDMLTLGILLIMMTVFLFMGAFMDWTGIVLLVMPVFLPIVLKLWDELGLTAVWNCSWRFCLVWRVVLRNMQVSFCHCRRGGYLKSVAPPQITLPDIFRLPALHWNSDHGSDAHHSAADHDPVSSIDKSGLVSSRRGLEQFR